MLKQRLHQIFDLRRAVQLVWKAAPGWTIASLVLLLMQSVLPVVILYTTKLMIDEVTLVLERPPEQRSLDSVLVYIAIAGAVALFDTLLSSINGLVSERQSRIVSDYVVTLIHEKSLILDLEYYENPAYQDSLHRVQMDAPFRPPRIVASLLTMLRSLFTMLSLLVLLTALSPLVALILFVASVPGLLVRLYYSRVMFAWTQRRSSMERRLAYINYMITLDYSAKEIRLFNLGKLLTGWHRELRFKLRDEQFAISTRRTLFDFLAQIGTSLAVIAAYGLISVQAVAGTITIGSLVMYFQAFQRGQGLLREILSSMAELFEHSLFLSNFYAFFQIQPHVGAPANPKPVPKTIQQGIVFENVSFRYPNADQNVLEDVNLTIEPGQVIALVGENGAGKSTLVKLLCRLYDPTSGRITLDGIDLREFDPVELRRRFSVIFQDFTRYHFTVQENIGFGDVEHYTDEQRVIDAAKAANIHDVIDRLPHKYKTMLGRMFDEGQELSIGQWQKVAIARAFMRPAEVMVLDEPTASLDVMSEHEVFQQFRTLVKGRSALLISHRLSTIKMAHRIYVLDNHRIVESGSHDELMAQEGIYAHLFNTQAEQFTVNNPL